jgi:predicted ATPase
VHILATSREALRVEGEWVVPLPSLESPEPSAALSAAAALEFPAVELFVQHASARAGEFLFSDLEAPVVAEICRRLDGNPLAIELAASSAAFFGVRELAARLDARLALSMKGRRTAPSRQRSLHATLDWSYDTLSESERLVLRRLSVFKGPFSLASAVAVVEGPSFGSADALNAMPELSAKSLLVADASGDSVRYRLLEVTRAYAAEKLAEAGEEQAFRRRHAEHHRDLFERAAQAAEPCAKAQNGWRLKYGWQIDDIRTALDWAFGAQGERSLGVALTVSTTPLWFQSCLLDEYRVYVERALDAARSAPLTDAPREAKLSLALGHLLLHTAGLSPEVLALTERARELSDGLDTPLRLDALWSAWFIQMAFADYAAAFRHAEMFGKLGFPAEDRALHLRHDRMLGLSLYYLGQPGAARVHLERVLHEPATSPLLAYTPVTHVDSRVSMQTTLACTLWLQGFPEQALKVIAEAIARAESLNHPTSLFHALTYGGCPVALWTGSLELGRRWITTLATEASRESLAYWAAWGHAFEAALRLHATPGEAPPPSPLAFNQAEVLATLHEDLLDAKTIARAEGGSIEWCAAEVARVRGTRLLKEAAAGAPQRAEALFLASIELARRQGSLSWELRTAVSLARLMQRQRRAGAAREVLAQVFQRFSEGFETSDLIRARLLLEELKPLASRHQRS